MKDEKLTLVGLRKQVAQRAGISEQNAERFLNELLSSVTNGLKADKQVRISGLGTFRVQRTEARRSVNVQTGEPIVIEGYNKVVFQPETMLKDRINLPVALEQNKQQETVVASAAKVQKDTSLDPLQKLGEQADEIKDILSELNTAQEEQKEQTVETTTEVAAELSAEENAGQENAPAEPEGAKPETEPEYEIEKKENEPASEPVRAKEPEPIILSASDRKKKEETAVDEEDENKKRSPRPWLVASITILIFCILLVCAYFFLRHQLTEWANGLLNKDKPKNEVVVTEEPVNTSDNTADFTEDAGETVVLPAREYKEFLATERLRSGSRLALLSRRYYGAPDFWVYIYEANADKISNPNLVRIGTKVRVPKLPKELVDPNSPAALEQAHKLQEQILGK